VATHVGCEFQRRLIVGALKPLSFLRGRVIVDVEEVARHVLQRTSAYFGGMCASEKFVGLLRASRTASRASTTSSTTSAVRQLLRARSDSSNEPTPSMRRLWVGWLSPTRSGWGRPHDDSQRQHG